jgi:DNA-binding CsgD family transcriptional regulator
MRGISRLAAARRRLLWMDAVVGLPDRRLRQMLDVLDEARRFDGDEVPPRCLLHGLADLVPGLSANFSEIDVPARRQLIIQDTDGAAYEEMSAEGMALYLRLRHQHPTCNHHETTGPLDVVQTSDMVTSRQLHQLEIYEEWFKTDGIEHIMAVPLPTAPGRTRVYQFFRDAGNGFSETERMMLQLLQPHLYGIYQAALRRRHMPVRLTVRQLDVLRCMASGLDNAGAARQLAISPATVTKHLENAYARLGVSNRTAALARVFGDPAH